MSRTSLFLLFFSILGALSGYLRELSLAAAYGAGALTDVYFVAISIPMVLGDLLVGSILTVCVIPVFSQLLESAPPAKHDARLLNAMLLTVVAMGGVIAVIVTWSMPYLIDLLVPGFDEGKRALLTHYANWLVWLLPVNAALLLSNLAMNVHRIFYQPAITWTAVNIIFFAVVFLGKELLGMDTLIWAALSGPVLLVLVNYWRLYQQQLFQPVKPDFDSVYFRQAIALARPVLMTFGVGSGLGLLMVSHVILRGYSSSLEDGAISALGYAFRIYEVPITLILSSAGVLILPVFSTLHHRQDRNELIRICKSMTGWGLILLVPLAFFVHAIAEPLVSLLFHAGAFSASDVSKTSKALQGFAPAIVFETAFMIFFRMFYGMHRPGITVGVGLLSILSLYAALEYGAAAITLGGLAFTLSASFALAALSCLAGLVYLLGPSILPTRREMAVVCGMVAGGMALPELIGYMSPGAGDLNALILGLAGFGLLCAALVWALLPARIDSLMVLMRAGCARLCKVGGYERD